MEPRLPAHVEIAGLIRRVQAEGGFATVVSKGHREAGTLMVVVTESGRKSRAWERMPQADGTRAWHLSRTEDSRNPADFLNFLERRAAQDDDLWIVELDIAHGERLIGAPEFSD
ncbi:hypothetical protein GCM10011371_15200 [Novosphingobium marinum]|uniref:DUF1491 family protein n=1 Tax=Novosphingobium marinum TaxID=1514948 RepID=A0A7Y9XYJ7_9SPHN|nr:DUF1491 family protein [Novosphingobium marinum]NYH95633.1 hypothetical protein [Novosphingobium marinum]GGC28591.1 hypothetical protein GCM10011371_15200 [Novosphingobium marinum]